MDNRIKRSIIENKQYIEKQKENNQDYVIKLVNEWIKKSGIEEFSSSAFMIDLRPLNQLLTQKYSNSVQSDTQKEVKRLETEIWKYGFHYVDVTSSKDVNKSEKHYIWVTFREDGMVVTVGKTNMRNGDLLKYEDLYSAGTGNTRIILQQLLTTEDRKRFDEINEKLYNYSQSALIIGINYDPINRKKYDIYVDELGKEEPETIEIEYNMKLNEFVIKLESFLRMYLSSNNINILNKELS